MRGDTRKLYFVQWLRVFLIALVVAHHAGQPYGPTGGRWPIDDPANAEWLGAFFAVNAAFFMGFFFLIAGYFTPGSHDRKGGAAFVRDRLVRLGIPLAFFTLVVFPVAGYFSDPPPVGFLAFYVSEYIGGWQLEMGPLWFVAQLLFYSLLYALFRVLLARRGTSHGRAYPVPGDWQILAYVLVLALAGAAVRIWAPQDRWVHLLWLIPTEPAHLPQYVSMFVIGIIAGRGQWFSAVSGPLAARWFTSGVVAFAIMVAAVVNQPRLPAWLDTGILWGFIEAFVCAGMILGLLALFRTRCNRPGRWLDRLDANIYGVYLIHIFIVVALQSAILAEPWSATAKFFFVATLGIVLSFAGAAALRRIPGLSRVI